MIVHPFLLQTKQNNWITIINIIIYLKPILSTTRYNLIFHPTESFSIASEISVQIADSIYLNA